MKREVVCFVRYEIFFPLSLENDENFLGRELEGTEAQEKIIEFFQQKFFLTNTLFTKPSY